MRQFRIFFRQIFTSTLFSHLYEPKYKKCVVIQSGITEVNVLRKVEISEKKGNFGLKNTTNGNLKSSVTQF